eukprot:gnl/TRDRNA2_/TRDRNA2_90272_c0_seq1.p1 gnl/TRDRNA2_/TRDRNA2_90272_c0~~gnl/TRDRNA2_/TRDRNA2_90272_c0_seq1.p1  ORF type:complete len:267 (+),score=34.59 gnl/TRDRNA2_/TRDRNA2_90272_c0_seq1:69-869(+)
MFVAMQSPQWAMACGGLLAMCLSVGMRSAAATVVNPTGDCQADTDGSRPGYHSVEPGTTYLPDCTCPLTREYWRVFAMDETDAYIIPRPDGLGLQYGYCEGADAELAALFKANDLCIEVLSDLSRINHMKPADALQITHALHEKLVFEARATNGEWEISPWAPDDDLLTICDTILTEDTDAQQHCQRLRGRCDENGACIDIGVVPTENAVKAFTPALNEFYGIDYDPNSIIRDNDATTEATSGAFQLAAYSLMYVSLVSSIAVSMS